jgi:hypothetical protein
MLRWGLFGPVPAPNGGDLTGSMEEQVKRLTEEDIAQMCEGLSEEEAEAIMNDPRVKPIVDKYLEKAKRKYGWTAKA